MGHQVHHQLTGQVFAMFLPALNQSCFALFGQELNQTLSEPTLLVADRASAHKASLLAQTQLVLTHLPTASPDRVVGATQPGGTVF